MDSFTGDSFQVSRHEKLLRDWRMKAGMLVLAAVAAACAIGALAEIPQMAGTRHTAQSYDSAKPCPATAASDTGCLAAVTATVIGVDVGTCQKGNRECDLDTVVTLDTPGVATVDRERITLDGDRGGDIAVGTRVPATTWNGTLVDAVVLGEPRRGPDQPDAVANSRLAAVVGCLLAAVVGGRIAAWWFFGRRVDPRRFERADFVLMPLTLLALLLALCRLVEPAAVLTVVTVAVLAVSCLVYPFLPWVRTSSPIAYRRGKEKPAAEPHPDWDMSDRPLGKKLW